MADREKRHKKDKCKAFLLDYIWRLLYAYITSGIGLGKFEALIYLFYLFFTVHVLSNVECLGPASFVPRGHKNWGGDIK